MHPKHQNTPRINKVCKLKEKCQNLLQNCVKKFFYRSEGADLEEVNCICVEKEPMQFLRYVFFY